MTDMICRRMRELMLEAEITELKGVGDSELARHVRACASCRAQAARLLHVHDALDAGLTKLVAHPGKRVLRWPRWVALPLAAAAVITLLMVRDAAPPEQRSDLLAALMFREPPIVTPPAGRQAIVMEKTDLTVVWLY